MNFEFLELFFAFITLPEREREREREREKHFLKYKPWVVIAIMLDWSISQLLTPSNAHCTLHSDHKLAWKANPVC